VVENRRFRLDLRAGYEKLQSSKCSGFNHIAELVSRGKKQGGKEARKQGSKEARKQGSKEARKQGSKEAGTPAPPLYLTVELFHQLAFSF
jgi:flagellar biosynthesis/type III secretory pathway protein FliH